MQSTIWKKHTEGKSNTAGENSGHEACNEEHIKVEVEEGALAHSIKAAQ